MNLRVRTTTAAVLGLLTLTLAGCGGESTSTADAGAKATVTVTASPSESASSPEPSQSADDSSAPSGDGPTRAELKAYTDTAQKQVESSLGSMNGTFTSIRVLPDYPDGIEFRYVFAKAVPKAAATTQLESYLPTLQTSFETIVGPEMRNRLGIAEPKATYTYLNPDKSVVWSKTLRMP